MKAICVLYDTIIDKEGIPVDEFRDLGRAEVFENSTLSDPQTFPANMRNLTRYAVRGHEVFQ